MWAISGIMFLPVYGLLNIFSYSIQISWVPDLARQSRLGGVAPALVYQMIQAVPDSLVGYLNGLAYAILGIPSIIFGILMIKDSKRISGWSLVINGIFCITGIIGYSIHSSILSEGTKIGGMVFLVSLIAIIIEFREKADT